MLTRRARHRRKFYWNKKIMFVAALLFLCVVVWQHLDISEEALAVTANASLQEEQYRLPAWRDILFLGVPGLVNATESKPTIIVKGEHSAQQMVREAMLFLIGIDIKDMRSILQSEIPMLAQVKVGPQTISAMSLPNFPKFEIKDSLPSGKPLVGLYYTHTAEAYVPNTGATHSPGGQKGDIVDV